MRVLVGCFCAIVVAACGSIEERKVSSSRPVTGQSQIAGVGDTVLDLRISQPLPNAFGRADVFGRTRDTGRVLVRYLGAQGDRAFFARQDVAIFNNDTTMSRTGMIVPTTQQTIATGYVGTTPVSATATTTGTMYIPPAPSTSVYAPAGQVQLSAPVGGSLYVEGKTLTVLRIGDGNVEYSVK